MRLFRLELEKLLGRPVWNFGIFLIMGFFMLLFWQDVMVRQTEIDGKIYQGIQAVEADRRLAKEYQGTLTMDVVEQIVERFGFSGYIEKEEDFSIVREGNFCSQWVTDKMTNFMANGEKPTSFAEGERWEEYGKKYLVFSVQFGYTGGWEYFHQLWSWMTLFINIWLVLMISPIFSEESKKNTWNILMSTLHGRQKDIWAKMAASLALGIFVFVMASLLLLGGIVCVYGGEGLELSAAMIDYQALYAWGGKLTVEGYLWNTFVSKLASVCFNICIVLYISSKCKNSISVVLLGLGIYPFSWLMLEVVCEEFFDYMYRWGLAHYVWGWVGMDLLRIICSITPYSLAWSSLIGIPLNWICPMSLLLIGAMFACIWRASINYREIGGGI